LSFGIRPTHTQAHLFGTTSVERAMMDEDYGKISHEALELANEMSERAIFWGLVFTVVVVAIGMLKGIFG